MKFLSYFKFSRAIAVIALAHALASVQCACWRRSRRPHLPEDIIDIRPPIHIAAPFPWLAWSAGALCLIAVSTAAWKLWRREKRKLAYEIALERLENTRPLMRESNAEPFSLAVSEIVRCFIEEVPSGSRSTSHHGRVSARSHELVVSAFGGASRFARRFSPPL